MASTTAGPLRGSNLEGGGQNRRLRLGATGLAVALVASVVLVEADVGRVWRALLFLPFYGAAYGAWQGLLRTCPTLARRGQREDHGEYASIASPERVAAGRKMGRKVRLASLMSALVATSIVVLIP